MQFPPNSPRPFVQLLQRCLAKEPENRPNFEEILSLLNEMYSCFMDGWRGLERQEVKSPTTTVRVQPQQLAELDKIDPQFDSRPLTEEILRSARHDRRQTARGEIESIPLTTYDSNIVAKQ